MCKMLFFERNGEYMKILAFVINSNYRQRGYGSFLLKESVSLARTLRCKVLTLNSGIKEERKNAHSFYTKNGLDRKSFGFVKYLL